MERHNRWQPWSPAENERLKALFRSGLTHAEMAKVIGLSDSIIGHHCIELGLRRRGPGHGHARWGAPEIEAVEIVPLSQRPERGRERMRVWVREIMERNVTR